MTPDFWLNLQRMYDLDVARATTDVSAIESLVELSSLLSVGDFQS
jgi:plasmid maintenance system antidote protein VapI